MKNVLKMGRLITVMGGLIATPMFAGTINLVLSNSNIGVGDTVFVDARINGAADVYAFQFDLSFDPALLSALSVSEGNFLPGGGSTFFIPGSIDNIGGLVSATADVLVSAVPGVNGDGTLAEFQFMALASGTSALSFSNPILLDSSLNDITSDSTFQTGSVTISSAGVPEPGSLSLIIGAIGGIGVIKRWRPFNMRRI